MSKKSHVMDISQIGLPSSMTDLGRTIKIKMLSDAATVPTKGTPDSAGFDLYAAHNQQVAPGQRTTIALGFSTELPPDVHARIESRSGNALKGYVVLTGVIDSDYRGEWKVIVQNFSFEPWEIAPGDRVAQAVLRPTLSAAFEEVDELTDTARGAGGFGSTGTR